MTYGIRLACFLVLSISASAQPLSKTEREAVERVKQVLASSLDSDLPKVSFEYFLKNEAKGSPINWSATSCAAQSTNGNDHSDDPSACLQAEFLVKKQGAVRILVQVKTPRVVSVIITNSPGQSRSVPRLGLLPMELRCPPPAPRLPKDLPNPGGPPKRADGDCTWRERRGDWDLKHGDTEPKSQCLRSPVFISQVSPKQMHSPPPHT